MKTVINLVDDYRPGGIRSLLDDMEPALRKPGCNWLVQVVNSAAPIRLQARPDIIVIHYSMAWRKLLWLMLLRLCHPNAKLVIVEHHYTSSFEERHVTHPRRFRYLLSAAYKLADQVIAVSKAQSIWLRAAGIASIDKITVIPSCRNYSDFLAIPRQEFPGGSTVIGAMGRLVEGKGFDVLIKAMRRLPAQQFQLRIAGDGDQIDKLKALAAGMNNVEFVGHTDNPAAFLAGCDLLAMPSRTESFGLVCAEAKAAGMPVVVSKVDALPQQAIGCGVVVEPEDVTGFADGIQYVADPHRLRRLSARARASVANAWTDYLNAWSMVLE